MTAACIGSVGTCQYIWSRNLQDQASIRQNSAYGGDTVWVTKRYIPTDLRSTAPVPRHKPLSPETKSLEPTSSHWVRQPVEMPSTSHDRSKEEKRIYSSMPSTRCEEWSTLRQMLPSRGRIHEVYPPNWGTGLANAPATSSQYQYRFPHINSPMTRYIDDMHVNHRQFKLY